MPAEDDEAAPYWDEQAAAIDLDRAKPFAYPELDEGPTAQAHTTHFIVADAAGNIATATQTLGNAFGSRIMPEGTGVWLNSSLAYCYCTFEPKGNPMDARPGQRKLSGDRVWPRPKTGALQGRLRPARLRPGQRILKGGRNTHSPISRESGQRSLCSAAIDFTSAD
jgi:hypothetical protein